MRRLFFAGLLYFQLFNIAYAQTFSEQIDAAVQGGNTSTLATLLSDPANQDQIGTIDANDFKSPYMIGAFNQISQNDVTKIMSNLGTTQYSNLVDSLSANPNDTSTLLSSVLTSADKNQIDSISPDDFKTKNMVGAFNQISTSNLSTITNSLGTQQYSNLVDSLTANPNDTSTLLSNILTAASGTQIGAISPDDFKTKNMMGAFNQISTNNLSTIINSLGTQQYSNLVDSLTSNPNDTSTLLSNILTAASGTQIGSISPDDFKTKNMVGAFNQISTNNLSTIITSLGSQQYSNLVDSLSSNPNDTSTLLSNILTAASGTQIGSISNDDFTSKNMTNALSEIKKDNPNAYNFIETNRNTNTTTQALDSFKTQESSPLVGETAPDL
ncbi:ribonuclease HII (plasmid) [Legionella adelaidensis]|uniref:Ribonuclease HII n=1 Tax=Legionella adelaidensis TaxID=45056 RepID=A0A0W0R1V8_9GAMM|nr:hypothetical protein [Legionella adelaidensis]KTC65062.1 Ribonuclease HII [Legionella adelaidensis]VEH85418.1 ribonuclease HII [Legionella adelaidensis]